MRRKPFILTCMLAILVLTIAFPLSVFAALTLGYPANDITTGKDIRVSVVNQEPDPVEPGRYITLRVKFENYGKKPTAEIIAGVKEQFPFTVLPGDQKEKSIGALGAWQTSEKGQIIEWKLYTNKDAAEGKNNITIFYRELAGLGATVEYKDAFSINVKTSDSVIRIGSIRTSPETIEPGKEAKVIIGIENIADSGIKDVKLRLDLDSLDFATIGSTSQQTLKTLDAGESRDMIFTVEPKASIDLSLYRIPLRITYRDTLNTEYSVNTSFGLAVDSPAHYIIGLEDSKIISPNQVGDVSVRISNNGVSNIKFMTAELKPSADYDILSSPVVYVGKIDSDDYESVTYKIYAKGAGAQRVSLRLLLSYSDSFNKEYTSEEEVAIPLYSDDSAKKYGLASKGSSTGILTIIVIIAAGLWYYFYRRKKKRAIKE